MSYQVKNTFSGIVDTDTSLEYLPVGSLVSAKNIDILGSGDDFIIRPMKGNMRIGGNITKGDTRYLGYAKWNHKLYLFFTDDANQNLIREWDSVTNTFTTVLTGDLGLPMYDDADIDTAVLSAYVFAGV